MRIRLLSLILLLAFSAPGDDGTIGFAKLLAGRNDDSVDGMAVDAAGNVYVGGTTRSRDFPATHTPPEPIRSYPAAFVTKLDPNGEIVYSALLGTGAVKRVRTDADGNTWLAGDGWLTFEGEVFNGGTFLGEMDPAGSGMRRAFNPDLLPRGELEDFVLGPSGSGYLLESIFVEGNWRDCRVTKLDPSIGAVAYTFRFGGEEEEVCRAVTVSADG
ncbi:MAG: hypothetical protein GY953_25755, partial [bacterium]|nr:hypothetical protein [bacterium]